MLSAGAAQVRVAVGDQSKRTAEAEGRENLDWEETLVRGMSDLVSRMCVAVCLVM